MIQKAFITFNRRFYSLMKINDAAQDQKALLSFSATRFICPDSTHIYLFASQICFWADYDLRREFIHLSRTALNYTAYMFLFGAVNWQQNTRAAATHVDKCIWARRWCARFFMAFDVSVISAMVGSAAGTFDSRTHTSPIT